MRWRPLSTIPILSPRCRPGIRTPIPTSGCDEPFGEGGGEEEGRPSGEEGGPPQGRPKEEVGRQGSISEGRREEAGG